MVVDVAEVFLQSRALVRHPPAVELADRLQQRTGGVLEDHQLLLQAIERLNDGAVVLARENAPLDFLELDFERVQHREIAIHDRIGNCVKDIARAMLQQLRLPLAAGAHPEEAVLGAAADRQDVVAADEYIDLADVQFRPHRLDDLQHREQRIAILFDLRPLMAVAGVFDRQLGQVELFLHRVEFFARGLEHRHPDETLRPVDVTMYLAGLDVGELFAAFIRDAVDEHRSMAPRCSAHRRGRGGRRAKPRRKSGHWRLSKGMFICRNRDFIHRDRAPSDMSCTIESRSMQFIGGGGPCAFISSLLVPSVSLCVLCGERCPTSFSKACGRCSSLSGRSCTPR